MKKVTALILMLGMAAVCSAQSVNPKGKPAARKEQGSESRRQIDDILLKYFQSLGDLSSAANIRSRVMRGTVESSPQNVRGTVERYSKSPNKMLSVLSLPGMGQFVEAYDGKNGWAQTPFTGAININPEATENFKGLTDGGRQMLREMFSDAAFKGKAVVGEREAYVLHLKPKKDGGAWTMYLDARSGFLLRLDTVRNTMWAKSVLVSIYFDGYAKVDGLSIPTVIREVYPDFTLTIRYYDIKHNVNIEDALFDLPQGAREMPAPSGNR